MADRGDEFSFFQVQVIHVRFHIRIDISISIRPMIAVDSDVITSRLRDQLKTLYLH